MHANSADVGGNNIPITGGTYNPDGLTVAQVLPPPAAGGPADSAATPGPHDVPVAQPIEHGHHHFEHMWG